MSDYFVIANEDQTKFYGLDNAGTYASGWPYAAPSLGLAYIFQSAEKAEKELNNKSAIRCLNSKDDVWSIYKVEFVFKGR